MVIVADVTASASIWDCGTPMCRADLNPQHHLLYRRYEPVQRAGIWRMEFWLSLVKVVAIIAMMLAGAGIIFWLWSQLPATGLETWSHGFGPNGWQGVIASLGIVMPLGGWRLSASPRSEGS